MRDEIKIKYDYNNGELITQNKRISFAYLENEVLNVLLMERDRFVSTREIEEKLYGPNNAVCFGSNISVYIHRIRKKLKGIMIIDNKKGYGYRIKKIDEQYKDGEGLYEL